MAVEHNQVAVAEYTEAVAVEYTAVVVAAGCTPVGERQSPAHNSAAVAVDTPVELAVAVRTPAEERRNSAALALAERHSSEALVERRSSAALAEVVARTPAEERCGHRTAVPGKGLAVGAARRHSAGRCERPRCYSVSQRATARLPSFA